MSVTATLASSAISIEAGIGLGVGGVLVAILLITLLSSKELLSSSKLNTPKVRKAMNLAIVPLLAVFVLNVTYMVAF